MNEINKKNDWLKRLRNFGLIEDNINIVFLIVFWLLEFKVVFYIFLTLTILNCLSRGYFSAKTMKELKFN